MTAESVKIIEKELQKVQKDLVQVSIEKGKLRRKESAIFDLHRDSLRSLRNLEFRHPEQEYHDLYSDIENLGIFVEQWAYEKMTNLKKEEDKLEEKLDSLLYKKRIILEEREYVDGKDGFKRLR